MPPKQRKSNSNHNKKRRTKNDNKTINTPNLTPHSSPSKLTIPTTSSLNPTTTTTTTTHSIINHPNHSNNKDHSIHLHSPPTQQQQQQNQKQLKQQPLIIASNHSQNTLDHQNIIPIHHPSLPEDLFSLPLPHPSSSPLIQSSPSNLLVSIKNSETQPAESRDQSGFTAPSNMNKLGGKQTLAVHRTQDVGGSIENENAPDSITHSKHETRKASDQINMPNGSNHSNDKPSTQRQRPADRVLKEILDHGNPLDGSSKQSNPHHPNSNAPPLKSSKDSSFNHHTIPVKKPIKHVKFTHNLKSDPSPYTSNQENHSFQQSDRHQANQETGRESDSKNQHVAIRREMSGAADQFDFDAQQRQHAGPGGGMVKKPRHDQNNTIHSVASNPNLVEPKRVTSVSPSGGSHHHLDHSHVRNNGFQHAQRSLTSLAQTQKLDQPNEHDPGLLQIHLSYFDQNQDGLLDPLDTWRAFRRLRFGLILATLATITLHAMIFPFIGVGSGLKCDSLGLCHLPVGHDLFESTCNFFNITATSLSGYVSVDHADHHYPDKISPSTLWKETRKRFGENQNSDLIGWLRVVFGWIIAIALTWPLDLTVNSGLVNGVYNGELLFLVAQESSS